MGQWAAIGHVGALAAAAVQDPGPHRLPSPQQQRPNWWYPPPSTTSDQSPNRAPANQLNLRPSDDVGSLVAVGGRPARTKTAPPGTRVGTVGCGRSWVRVRRSSGSAGRYAAGTSTARPPRTWPRLNGTSWSCADIGALT